MATVVQHVKRPHPCQEEIRQLDTPEADLWVGSVAECSCGKWYTKQEDYRGEQYWSEISKLKIDHIPDEVVLLEDQMIIESKAL